MIYSHMSVTDFSSNLHTAIQIVPIPIHNKVNKSKSVMELQDIANFKREVIIFYNSFLHSKLKNNTGEALQEPVSHFI